MCTNQQLAFLNWNAPLRSHFDILTASEQLKFPYAVFSCWSSTVMLRLWLSERERESFFVGFEKTHVVHSAQPMIIFLFQQSKTRKWTALNLRVSKHPRVSINRRTSSDFALSSFSLRQNCRVLQTVTAFWFHWLSQPFWTVLIFWNWNWDWDFRSRKSVTRAIAPCKIKC